MRVTVIGGGIAGTEAIDRAAGLLREELRRLGSIMVDFTYTQRASLRSVRLNDVAGALADYQSAIELNPRNAMAYHQRGVLRADKVNDREGAILDFRQAASLYQEQDNPLNLQKVLEWLRRFNVSP